MPWVPPVNRSNQHIERYKAELYIMPKSDKTGLLSDLTIKANAILASITFKYTVGMRVVAIDRRNGVHILGEIRSADWNIGINEYLVRDDSGKNYFIAEKDILLVLSVMVAPVQAIVSTQHTQTDQLAA